MLSFSNLTSDENTRSRKCDRDTEYVSMEIKLEFFSDFIIASPIPPRVSHGPDFKYLGTCRPRPVVLE